MTYPIAFRKHVFEVKKKLKLTYRQTAERFCISLKTLVNWQQQIEPKATKKRRASKIDMQALEHAVKEHPDRYQHEHASTFGVSQTAICYAIKRLGHTHKKRPLNTPRQMQHKGINLRNG